MPKGEAPLAVTMPSPCAGVFVCGACLFRSRFAYMHVIPSLIVISVCLVSDFLSFVLVATGRRGRRGQRHYEAAQRRGGRRGGGPKRRRGGEDAAGVFSPRTGCGRVGCCGSEKGTLHSFFVERSRRIDDKGSRVVARSPCQVLHPMGARFPRVLRLA